MTWKALLLGDAGDLESLRTIFGEGDPKLSVDDEGTYALESSAFDSTEAVESMEAAKRILEMMNGAAKVQDPSYRAVRLAGRFHSKDGHQHVVVLADTVKLRSRVRLRSTGFVVGAGGVPVDPPPTPARLWPGLAQGNQNVADVLRLLAPDDLDWMALYKVVEVVRADVGGTTTIFGNGWVTEDEWKRFGTSANHPEASGDMARHARMPGHPKQTMALAEGRRFVLELAGAWLRWRMENP